MSEWRGRDELAACPLHVLVRDYPEVLSVLRAAGIDVRSHGPATLQEVSPSAAVLDSIENVIAWRRRA